jgi:hypothetical protein
VDSVAKALAACECFNLALLVSTDPKVSIYIAQVIRETECAALQLSLCCDSTSTKPEQLIRKQIFNAQKKQQGAAECPPSSAAVSICNASCSLCKLSSDSQCFFPRQHSDLAPHDIEQQVLQLKRRLQAAQQPSQQHLSEEHPLQEQPAAARQPMGGEPWAALQCCAPLMSNSCVIADHRCLTPSTESYHGC